MSFPGHGPLKGNHRPPADPFTCLPLFGGVDLSFFGGKTDRLTKSSKVDLSGHRPDRKEGAPSGTIEAWAQEEYSKLIKFAIDFRSQLGEDLETGGGRKVKVQVGWGGSCGRAAILAGRERVATLDVVNTTR